MASVRFEDLALQYVLADEPEQERSASETAASVIEASSNNRVLVGQWVSSINRWMPLGNSGDDGPTEDDDFISRAKALDFLASTLAVLKRDILKADQVQLLVNFFCSLFSSDHKAGITASAKALQQLTNMKMFKPPIGNDIIEGVCKLGGDYKLQAPATRLEIYNLILWLLQDPSVSKDLDHRHGDTCGFMLGLLNLCRNERDPNNLMKWFETLRIFLQNFSPSADVTSEVFKTFSAYFPISLRASATPSGITADDLKGAVRSCFAAHYRLAGHAIPFLLSKLDQGDAVTVAVKLDILQTLDACVSQYAHPKQGVVSFVDQIWSSLKYEVRNGEISETIEATLKVITSLTRRLDEEDLRPFFMNAWRDLEEDISSPTYVAQAGRLLVAILGADTKSFSMVTRALSHILTTIKSTKSASHKRDLLALLNAILLVRSHLVASRDTSQSLENPLKDELFGDSLFVEIYLPLWQEESGHISTERVEVLSKVMEGMAALVSQQSYEIEPHRLTTDSTCTRIFSLLSNPIIIDPLNGESLIDTTQAPPEDELRDYAASALKKAVPLYPQGFQQLLLQYLTTVQTLYKTHSSSGIFVSEIKQVAITLCDVACPEGSRALLPLPDYISLINSLLNSLFWMLEQRAPPRFWSAFISSIYLAVSRSLATVSAGTSQAGPKPQPISAESYAKLSASYEQILQIKISEQGDTGFRKKVTQISHLSDLNDHQQLLVYCICVLKQLYRRFTDVYPSPLGSSGKQRNIGIHGDLLSSDQNLIAQQDICLHQLAFLATSVVRSLDEDEQKALRIDQEAFAFFHGDDESSGATRLREEVLSHVGEFSPLHEYRTAPLSMGILQGVFPGALDHEYHINALKCLTTTLTSIPSPCSDMTRAALDTIWTILSNKFVVKGEERRSEWLALQGEIAAAFERIWGGDGPGLDVPNAIRVFRSILHFLSGDVARFQGGAGMNGLLRLVCERAPSDPATGRRLAGNFGLLLSPKECLQRENHAVRKRLAEAWVYHQAVQPYLRKCLFFPGSDGVVRDQEEAEEAREGGGGEEAASSRAVAVFALLRHARYEHYADDVAQVVRVAIRSLDTLARGAETEPCLAVLLDVLERDPGALKGHLAGLTKGMIRVYEEAKAGGSGSGSGSGSNGSTARRAAGAAAAAGSSSPSRNANSLNTCRKLVLDFFRRLPATYEAHTLILYRKQLLRPLSTACGDPVREVRRVALAARQSWENLA